MNVYKVKVTNSCLLFRTLWFSVFNTTKNKQRDTWYLASWYFKIVPNFTHLTAHEITYNNFEISLMVFMPNINTNHAITYTNTTENKQIFIT